MLLTSANNKSYVGSPISGTGSIAAINFSLLFIKLCVPKSPCINFLSNGYLSNSLIASSTVGNK